VSRSLLLRHLLSDRVDSIYSNIPAASGDMGILANHVPTVEALRPGLVEIIESGSTKKYFGKEMVMFNLRIALQPLILS
jgi:F-type H+-transporting ATPase subunit delta